MGKKIVWYIRPKNKHLETIIPTDKNVLTQFYFQFNIHHLIFWAIFWARLLANTVQKTISISHCWQFFQHKSLRIIKNRSDLLSITFTTLPNLIIVNHTFLVSVVANRSSNWSVFIVFRLAFSALMTALATISLNSWRLIFLSSIVPLMMRRCTFTTFRWPSRCALSIACKCTGTWHNGSLAINRSNRLLTSPSWWKSRNLHTLKVVKLLACFYLLVLTCMLTLERDYNPFRNIIK